jgi:hypothetical protein
VPVKRVLFLLNAAFAIAIVDLISQVHLPPLHTHKYTLITHHEKALLLLLSSSSLFLPDIPYPRRLLWLFVYTNRHGKWQYLFTQLAVLQAF